MTRTYNLAAVVEAHRASANGGAAMRNTVEPNAPQVNEKWRYKPNRGTGGFTVVRVRGDRITLRSFMGKDKTISLRTLRGDYEPVPNGR